MRSSASDWIWRLGVLLAIIGALNWGLVGLFEWNLVAAIFGDTATQTATTAERIVYVLVGIGGILAIPMLAGTMTRSRTVTGTGAGVRTIHEEEPPMGRKAA